MPKQELVELASGAKLMQRERAFGVDELWRVAIWGLAAASALTLAALAGTSAIGVDRLMQAAGQLQGVIKPIGNRSPRPLDAGEGRRLAQSVQLLADDRERLLVRMSAIEHTVDSMTEAISRMNKTIEAFAERPTLAPVAAALPPAEVGSPEPTPAEEATASVSVVAGLHEPPPASSPQARPTPDASVKTEYGLDIGGGGSIVGLRTLWAAARQKHPAALDSLRPVVHLRESRRPGGVELRLIAGPLSSAVAAARLCATLNAAGTACQPAVFDGQRLATR